MSEIVDYEIERRFAVNGIPKSIYPSNFITKVLIYQGYIMRGENEGGVFRLRKIIYEKEMNTKYILSVKRNDGEYSNIEVEFEITCEQFNRLWKLVGNNYIVKDRWTFFDNRETYDTGNVIYTIDEYRGKNKGLFIFEIEFKSVDDAKIWKPFEWLERELHGELSASKLAYNEV
jgi:CYTH domain-containing protein